MPRRLRSYYWLGVAITAALSLPSCEPGPSGVIDSQKIPPILTLLRLNTSSVNTDTILVQGLRKPTDLLTIRIPATVRVARIPSPSSPFVIEYQIQDPNGRATGETGAFLDNGLTPDSSTGDSLYSAIITFSTVRSAVGRYSVRVTGHGSDDMVSPALIAPVQLIRLNQPPMLSNLIADSTVILAATTQILDLRITATDPDGASDIQKVFFNSFRPDGSASGGNPFTMYDDGNASGISSDQIAGDGIYSLRIQIAPTATAGVYRFEFQAVDRSSDSSTVLIHRITVRP